MSKTKKTIDNLNTDNQKLLLTTVWGVEIFRRYKDMKTKIQTFDELCTTESTRIVHRCVIAMLA